MRVSPSTAEIKYADADHARGIPIPWWGKMGAKLVLHHTPGARRLAERLGLFKPGDLATNVERVVDGFEEHLTVFRDRAGKKPDGVLELGPGNSIGRALCAAANGARRSWFIDAGDHATGCMDHYRAVAQRLWQRGTPPPDLDGVLDRDGVLARSHAQFSTDGLDGLKRVPDKSVDLVFSDAVLEHLPASEFDSFLHETRRVLAQGGLASHGIEYHDHLGGGLEHLRFAPTFWERRAVAEAGFYTNRMLHSRVLAACERAGFDVEILWELRWPQPRITRDALHPSFRDATDDDLTICAAWLVLRPR
jgi:SAM-dependent methyltransferase